MKNKFYILEDGSVHFKDEMITQHLKEIGAKFKEVDESHPDVQKHIVRGYIESGEFDLRINEFIKQNRTISFKNNDYICSKTATDEISKIIQEKEILGHFQGYWIDSKGNDVKMNYDDFKKVSLQIGSHYRKLMRFKRLMKTKSFKTEKEIINLDLKTEWGKF